MKVPHMSKSIPIFRLEFLRTLGSSSGEPFRSVSLDPDYPRLADVPYILDYLRDLIEEVNEARAEDRRSLPDGQ
jgi:hypothetical protein